MNIIKIIMISMVFITLNVLAEEKSKLAIHVSKQLGSNTWLLSFQLPHNTRALDFSHLPPNFLKQHLMLNTEASLTDKNVIQLMQSDTPLVFEITDGFDVSELRFNAPFINFSDNSAFFADFIIPLSVTVSGQLLERQAFDVAFTLSVLNEDWHTVNTRELDSASLSSTEQFISLKAPIKTKGERIAYLIEPDFPSAFKVQVEQIIDGFMDFFEQQSGQSLARDITFLISGDSNAPYIGFLGSALNNQVMLNISGKEAVIHPEKFKRPIYLTLAHEIFHLWNAHLWSPKENTPIWLYEGSADFFAYHAMLQQGLMPQSHFDYFLQQQQKACLEGVKQAAITYLESTSAIGASYPCGRVFFEELTKALNKSHFEIWQDLMAVNRAVQYSVEDVHSLIKQSKVPSDIKQQLEHVLFDNKKAHNALEKLLLAPAIE